MGKSFSTSRLSVSALVRCPCGEVSPPYKGLVAEFEHIHNSGMKNYQKCRRPVKTKLNIPMWRQLLHGYHDVLLCDMLEFGFPLDVQGDIPPTTDFRAHKGARDYPDHVNKYLKTETSLGRMAGPFPANPFSVPIHVSPMNTVPKDESDERRIIADLSWPLGSSVNDNISSDTYLGEECSLRYTTIEDICNLVVELGSGCVIYKRDLKKAYRQIPVDPGDYRFLGYRWEGSFYFDSVLVMGQRNAAMACQRTTNGVMYIHGQRGHNGAAYLDDLIGVSVPELGTEAYDSLGVLLRDLGLEENASKACPPATSQTVLGIQVDSISMTLSVTTERLAATKDLLAVWQSRRRCTKTELRSLLGKLCCIVRCVRQSRVFINRLLAILRSFGDEKYVMVSPDFYKDIVWWSTFMTQYNGVSFIPPVEWTAPDVVFTTDSTLTGCGGLTDNEYFHTPFPPFILEGGYSINALEILAVTVSVGLWGRHYAGQKILIYCDNKQAVLAINSGKTREALVGTCVRQLWLEVSTFGFQLKAVHLPGVENRLADSLSRWHLSAYYCNQFMEATKGLPLKLIDVPSDLFRLNDAL